jgi:SAM-dependent methyltransferase
MSFDDLAAWARTAEFTGWDFGVFRDRFTETEPPWSYDDLVRSRLPGVGSLLDLGTGGGERFATVAPLPARTAATEGYAPNLPVARDRLTPLGVEVAEDTAGFADDSFELVTSRHDEFDPVELRRLLVPGGRFITQQVGGRDLHEINDALGAPPHEYRAWDLATAERGLTDAGFTVTWRAEATPPGDFRDLGALLLFLRITPWHVPGFTVERYENRLRDLHERMSGGAPMTVTCHRFALVAELP